MGIRVALRLQNTFFVPKMLFSSFFFISHVSSQLLVSYHVHVPCDHDAVDARGEAVVEDWDEVDEMVPYRADLIFLQQEDCRALSNRRQKKAVLCCDRRGKVTVVFQSCGEMCVAGRKTMDVAKFVHTLSMGDPGLWPDRETPGVTSWVLVWRVRERSMLVVG